MVNIADKIERLLTEKRLGKKDLVDVLGVSRSGLHHKMKTNAFKAGDIKLMCDFFNVSEDFFLKEDYEEEKRSLDYRLEAPKIDGIVDRFLEELNQLRSILQKKDEQIDKLIDLLGKLEVSPEMPPVREGAVILPLRQKRSFVANSRANSCAIMIA